MLPLMLGAAVFKGAVAPPETAATGAVGADEDVVEPTELAAVTASRMVLPVSFVPSTYVGLVAPRMGTHFPNDLQRFHA